MEIFKSTFTGDDGKEILGVLSQIFNFIGFL